MPISPQRRRYSGIYFSTTKGQIVNQTTLAPSEQHLEDWIAARNGYIHADKYPEHTKRWKLLKRQAKLPHGRAALIVTDGGQVIVIELKRGALDTKALAQVLRYVRDLRDIWNKALKERGMSIDQAHTIFPYTIAGLLIGHSIDDDINVAATAAGVGVYLYQYTGAGYVFEFTDSSQMNAAQAEEFSYGYLGEAMRAALDQYLDDAADDESDLS